MHIGPTECQILLQPTACVLIAEIHREMARNLYGLGYDFGLWSTTVNDAAYVLFSLAVFFCFLPFCHLSGIS